MKNLQENIDENRNKTINSCDNSNAVVSSSNKNCNERALHLNYQYEFDIIHKNDIALEELNMVVDTKKEN